MNAPPAGAAGVHVLPLPAGGALRLGERPLLMGIVNATPDSFSDGGLHATAADATAAAERLVDEGADLIDVGGESTRPGAAEISCDEQLRRVLPVIRALRERRPDVPLSIDTRSARVAGAAIEAGASIVNDVSAFAHDPDMAATVAAARAPAVLMHMRGTPADMRERTAYGDVVEDVLADLRARIADAHAAGVAHVIADPGLGFAKTAAQSAALLAATPRLLGLGVPLLVGPSRKSFLTLATGERNEPASAARLHATVAAATVAALLGAHVVRVHDVAACRDGVRLAQILRTSEGWTSPDRTASMGSAPADHPM